MPFATFGNSWDHVGGTTHLLDIWQWPTIVVNALGAAQQKGGNQWARNAKVQRDLTASKLKTCRDKPHDSRLRLRRFES